MLLLYCMTEPNINVTVPPTGVRGGAVTSLVEETAAGDIRCFYSDSDLSNTSQHTNQIAVDAMEFDAVVRGIFKEVAVIPFRFMTALGNADDVRTFLKKNGDEYALELKQVRDKIQMEVRVTAKQTPRATEEDPSGTDFLKAKQGKAKAVEDAAEKIIGGYSDAQWKRKSASDGCRLYALIERGQGSAGAEKFVEAMKKVALGPDFNARTSGPWPATEFINCYADLQTAVAGAAKK